MVEGSYSGVVESLVDELVGDDAALRIEPEVPEVLAELQVDQVRTASVLLHAHDDPVAERRAPLVL
jgi:hypothetical protein